MISRVSTKGMSREDWLNARRRSIGGSDAGALLGLNPYNSPYALWAEKTGKIVPEGIGDREAVRLGNDLEQYVAERWMEATGKKLRRDNSIIYNSEYPFAHANIDRAVIGEPDAGFEAKTTSSFDVLAKCRAGEFPYTWYAQVTHYMMVTGARRWYLGVLCLGHGFFHFVIERNEAEIKALAGAERSFWDGVCSNIPPALDGSQATQNAIRAIFPESTAGRAADLTGVGSHIATFLALEKEIKELEEAKTKQQNIIMEFMEDAERGEYNGVKISYKTQERKTFDRKGFEAANGPIAPAFFKTSQSRPFRVTAEK